MRRTYLFILILLGCVLFAKSGKTVAADSLANETYVGDEILVKFSADVSAAQKTALNRLTGAVVMQEFSSVQWNQLRLPQNLPVAKAIEIYRSQPGVVYAQPNYRLHLTAAPDDPNFSQQYGLQKISAPTAWDTTTGSNDIVVAIIDTGLRATHQDLAANVWVNPGEIAGNNLDDDGNGFVDDVNGYNFAYDNGNIADDFGHGAHVAGIIGAVGNNGTGVTGVNWRVKLMPVKLHDAAGNATIAQLIKCFQYVTLMKQRGVNIRVTNNSYGGPNEAPYFDQATKDAIDAAGAAGILNVFAAGNDGRDIDTNPTYPASYDSPLIVSVANTNSADNRAGSSNFGIASVDLGAPGSGILSTWHTGDTAYATISGTSMASPHVAGAAALLAAAHPELSAYSLKGSLLNSTDQLSQLSGVVLTGGRLNIARAIQQPTVCNYVLNANGGNVSAHGGNLGVVISAPTNCGWTTNENFDWVTIMGSATGAGNGNLTLTVAANPAVSPRTATVVIAGQSYLISQAGAVAPTPTPAEIQSVSFNNATYAANENAADGQPTIRLTVTRAGGNPQLSGTLRVDYLTEDGTARQRTDYTLAAGTLTFAPGESSKTITVSLIDDGYSEGVEQFGVRLSNVRVDNGNSARLGQFEVGAITVADDDLQNSAANPVEDSRIFARQQYLDFLAREPDPGGWNYWTGQISACGTADAPCLARRRVEVSAQFFIELEFQESGAFVYRLYKSAFGAAAEYRPTYAQFAPDRARVVGGSNLAQGKLDFAAQFVARGEFTARYPATLTPTEFTDALLAVVQQGAGVSFTATERQSFINDAESGGRGLLLRNLADAAAFRTAVYNRAFVLMQYFGYLRRDPDAGGYNYWLGVVQSQGDYRVMVCNFVTAREYQERFGAQSPRSNQKCAVP